MNKSMRNSLSASSSVTRRDFLKLGSLALLGMVLPRMPSATPAFPPQLDSHFLGAAATQTHAGTLPRSTANQSLLYQQGRILDDSVSVMDSPGFSETRLKLLWKDAVVPILGVTYSEDNSSHNQVWYQIGEKEYVHSGVVQPVRTSLNQIIDSLPEGGVLAEVTVPYTDAHWKPSRSEAVAYRFYYETTHWIIGIMHNEDGTTWYQVLDDKWELSYYVQAPHLRIIPAEELAPISPHIPSILKYLEVRLADQLIVAYEGYIPVFMARIASGARFSDGNFSTPHGSYLTFHKRPSRHMAAGNLAANGYDLPGVPWICYFTESGIALHGTYWHNNYGAPRSHGCINLTPQASKWIYRWTHPFVHPYEQMRYEDYGTSLRISETGEL
jgi:hypothetical protein